MNKSVFSRRWVPAVSLMLAAMFAAPAQAYSGLFVFGDSLSDNGNNAAVLFGSPFFLAPTPPAAITSNSFVAFAPSSVGTYSNGPVWADAVATALLGSPFPARASLLGGTNYASGGAETRLNTPVFGSTIPTFSLQSQVNFYLASLGSTPAPSDALYVVEGGANNVRRLLATGAAFDPLTVSREAAAYANDVGGMVDQLQLAGAKNIIVWNTPNSGLTPQVLSFGTAASVLATSVATQFNSALATRLAGEVGVKTFDIFGAIANFSNVTDACGNNASGCGANPQFWDGIHPTAGAHALIAQGFLAVANPVPEPSTYTMFLVGLIGCGWTARRRHG